MDAFITHTGWSWYPFFPSVQLDASLTRVLCSLGSGSFIPIQFGNWLSKFHPERPKTEMTKKAWSNRHLWSLAWGSTIDGSSTSRWPWIVPCLAEQLRGGSFGWMNGWRVQFAAEAIAIHSAHCTNRCRRAHLPNVLEKINSGSRSHEETFPFKAVVSTLEARCDRKRINTCPSGSFLFSSSSYIWSG